MEMITSRLKNAVSGEMQESSAWIKKLVTIG